MKQLRFLLPLTAALLLSCATGQPAASSEPSSEAPEASSVSSETISSESDPSIESEPSSESVPSSESSPSSESIPSEESKEPTSYYSYEDEDGYYAGIDLDGSGAALKTKLAERISKGYQTKSYDYAYTAYPSTDTDEEGKIIDVYSAYRYDPVKDHQGAAGKGNYNAEGQMFNREHTIPQSVFSEGSPMKSDLHHLLPTDAYVNNRRSNFPHAYVETAKYTSTNKTLVGTSASTKNHGYSGSTVCEVPDQYKGDIARIYFYMVTRYQDKLSGWKSYDAFSKNSYPSLTKWAVQTYLEWSDLDPVSEKEIKRNEAVFQIQENRNPFIDYPSLAHQIWDNAYAS